jgi:uncharacterized membrane protein
MRKIHVFLFVLSITLAVLVTLALVSYYYAVTAPSFYGSSWMSQMWGDSTNGNGMGGMMGNGSSSTEPSYLWLIPTVLSVVVAAALIGVGFYMFFPELKYLKTKTTCTPTSSTSTATETETVSAPATPISTKTPTVSEATDSCAVLMKTMTPDEQKVLKVLIAHKGKYLQKYVVKEAELSRLKTHRIIARFVERGIVSVKEFGNTNEVVLADWVTSSKQ